MKTASRTLWLSASGLGLIGLAIGVFFWLITPQSIPPELPDISPTNPVPTLAVTVSPSPPTELISPPLPPVEYVPGSIGHDCGVNEFPPFHWYLDLDSETRLNLEDSPYDSNGDWQVLEGECKAALERHLYETNPYLWFDATKNRQFAFINIDNPLTFERLFTDPTGDLLRVQVALARPECQLGENAESEWQLHETCHADALLNFALITRYCYNEGVRNRERKYYWEENNPTPKQDRSMWIQSLESGWLEEKCASLDPILDLQSEVHTALRAQLRALYPTSPMRDLDGILIELAARLGDDAAALTRTVIRPYDIIYSDEGYKYGPLAGWFTNLFEPAKLFTKHPPSVDRLRRLVLLFGKNLGAAGGKFIQFDYEALAQHLCAPPYYTSVYDKDPDPPSCREVINELRQEELHTPMLEAIATFEDVAMRLEVFE